MGSPYHSNQLIDRIYFNIVFKNILSLHAHRNRMFYCPGQPRRSRRSSVFCIYKYMSKSYLKSFNSQLNAIRLSKQIGAPSERAFATVARLSFFINWIIIMFEKTTDRMWIARRNSFCFFFVFVVFFFESIHANKKWWIPEHDELNPGRLRQ